MMNKKRQNLLKKPKIREKKLDKAQLRKCRDLYAPFDFVIVFVCFISLNDSCACVCCAVLSNYCDRSKLLIYSFKYTIIQLQSYFSINIFFALCYIFLSN